MKQKHFILLGILTLLLISAFSAQAQTSQRSSVGGKEFGQEKPFNQGRPEFASGTRPERIASGTPIRFASSTKGIPPREEFASSTNPTYAGKITTIDSSSSFTIESIKKDRATTTYTVLVDNATLLKGTTTVSTSDISVGSHVLIHGTLNNSTITATKVLVLPDNAFNQRVPEEHGSSTAPGIFKKIENGIGNVFRGIMGWFR